MTVEVENKRMSTRGINKFDGWEGYIMVGKITIVMSLSERLGRSMSGGEGIIANVSERTSRVIRGYRDNQRTKWLLLAPMFVMFGILLVIPTLLLIKHSLTPFINGQIQDGFTLNHYARLQQNLYLDTTIRTFKIAAIVTVVDFLLGFPLAYKAVRGGKRVGQIIVILTFAPITIDLVVRSFGWFILLNEGGMVPNLLKTIGLIGADSDFRLIFNERAIIIGLVHVQLPFMVFPIINVLHTIPESLEEAARDLGANRLTVFTRVIFPLALPGIMAGTLIVFVLSAASYVTPAILGGGVQVLPIMITESFTATQNWPFASALAVILVAISVLIIIGYQWTLRQVGSVSGGGN